jgi:hypothetical protein
VAGQLARVQQYARHRSISIIVISISGVSTHSEKKDLREKGLVKEHKI